MNGFDYGQLYEAMITAIVVLIGLSAYGLLTNAIKNRRLERAHYEAMKGPARPFDWERDGE